jgi:predicted AlkP superfamily phosphohydrolase/phosphomutase
MKKALLIGLDGASFDFLMPWVEEGKLPIFKRIIEEGTRGVMKSTVPCVTCPALPTIYTGMNPGNLGIFDFLNPDGTVVSSSQIQYKSLWHILSERNKKSLVSNLRTTYPPEKIYGTMICSLHVLAEKVGLSSWEKAESSWVYPKELQKELDGWAVDTDNFAKNILRKLSVGAPEGYENLKKLVEFRASKFKQLLLRDDYDFAFHWIEHTDTINHVCWGNKQLILQFYREVIEPILDDYLSTFKDWNMLIISDHGAAEQTLYRFHVNTWLKMQGYMRTKIFYPAEFINCSVRRFKKIIPKFVLAKLLDYRKKHLPIKEAKNVVLPDSKHMLVGVDWQHTSAYCDISWGIRINKENSGKHDEALRTKIISELIEIKSPLGGKLIKNAWRKEDIYFGKYIDRIPDIVILPQNHVSPDRILSFQVLTPARKTYTGSHNFARNGIFMACGPDISQAKEISPLNLYDIVPTILFMLDVEIPKGLDGKVAKEIFDIKSEYYKKRLIFSEESIERTAMIRDLSKAEEEQVKKKLKYLGYLD